MVLDGTIPMFHNQKKYNCPVKFWLGLDYPTSPPTCYVSPTRDMGIKPRHVHVDNAGFIYHQYLTQWSVRSTLKDLCSTLTTVFSKDPPVYAKPQGGQATQPSQQPQPVQQPPPPPPPQQAAARPASQPVPASAGGLENAPIDLFRGGSHPPPPPQHPSNQASSRPPPPPPAAAGRASPAGAHAGDAGERSAVEQESKDNLIQYVMSKINVKRSSLCLLNAAALSLSLSRPPPGPAPAAPSCYPLHQPSCKTRV